MENFENKKDRDFQKVSFNFDAKKGYGAGDNSNCKS